MSATVAVPAARFQQADGLLPLYVEMLALIERLHRLLLDVIKDEFERIGQIDVNAVQALLLFNIGEHEVTAGELKSRGYYQGSNVSYNLKKLVDAGYMHHKRCDVDRRSVRVSLTDKGQEVSRVVEQLFQRHHEEIGRLSLVSPAEIARLNAELKQLEQFWVDQIRFIY
jgi:DNA-binding MarR family transcriptional regulator